MDTINIQVSENQSENFFSRLQQQINQEPTKEPTQEPTKELNEEPTQEPIQEPTQESIQEPTIQLTQEFTKELTLEPNNFLNKINSTSKNLGHNKLQLRIEELENKIEGRNIIEKEQEMKLNLFKKTIATLQAQLQDKSAHISRIESKHIDPLYEKKIADLNHEISISKMNLANLQEQNRVLKREYDFATKKLDSTNVEYDMMGSKTIEVQQRYHILEQACQKQANQLQIDLETISRLENKLNLELNIKQNLELELQSLKLELSDYQTNIKNLTILKDNEIKILNEKLITNSVSNLDESKKNKQVPQNIIMGGPRGIKPSSGKGITSSSSKGIRTFN